MKKMIVLGPAGSNGHEAALKALASHTQQLVFSESNLEILERCEREGNSVVGCVPVENSSAGLVSEVVRDFWLTRKKTSLVVIGEVTIPIRHCLLIRTDTDIDGIDFVMSHPQALMQCSRIIRKYGWRSVPAKSTSLAAREISERLELRTTAVLASRLAGEVYRLKTLEENVGDCHGNATRFHFVSSSLTPPTGKDRTALMFKLRNEPQALLRALTAMSTESVNISSIHSIPLGDSGAYAFYVECDIHRDSDGGRAVLYELKKVSHELIILGSYPQSVA